MALTLFGGRRSDIDPFGYMMLDPFSLPSLLSFPNNPSFARDVSAVASTQVDWKETPDAHIFKVNLPGLSKDDVKVQVENGNVLQISGKRKIEEKASTDRWHRVERAHGSFLRRFRLPKNAKLDEVKASMDNGVLSVIVLKATPPEHKSEVRDISISE
ncbi:hypothetical protein GOP47_0020980 [Adiantum capillus-veneris]|uniref:SHSP domain-containing protein n=1 Tax=Adiantum capillus-veneris TaxID=13818 RepID=A0A9D4UAF8_ADICA|nr:hypothetical protein GOP47_0020980 [Adiantum capillus-veneris]